MEISISLSRLTEYYGRNGFTATIRRAGLSVKRALFSNRMIIFYCDLAKQTFPNVALPNNFKIDRLKNESELSRTDLQQISSFWNPKLARREIKERFAKGALLWLIKSGDVVAGYSWTVRGSSIGPYYFPLAHDDVQLFDFYAFPKFRGRAILWPLVMQILRTLGLEGCARVFGDVAEWNEASLSFYKMTPFRCLGWARRLTVCQRTIVCWTKSE